MKEITNSNDYHELINEGKPVLLDFYADWCGPCQALLPTIEKLANKYETDFNIAKINVDKNAELAQKFSVRSIPALFFLQNGEVVEKFVGIQSESLLENKIQNYAKVA